MNKPKFSAVVIGNACCLVKVIPRKSGANSGKALDLNSRSQASAPRVPVLRTPVYLMQTSTPVLRAEGGGVSQLDTEIGNFSVSGDNIP